MTLEDIDNNRSRIECFYCGSNLGNFPESKYIALFSSDGVISIKCHRTGNIAPMVYCSSDCMCFESNIRYNERVKNGTFRKQFTAAYETLDRMPKNWKDEN